MNQRALIFHGGWDGHHPAQMADLAAKALRQHEFEVEVTDSLECLADGSALAAFDLIVPCWTMGKLEPESAKNLCNAVQSGTGLGGFHGGMGDAFRGELDYEWMVGGHFVGHPHVGPYEVRVTRAEHPIMEGMPNSFEYDSEQYYMMTDPAIEVLADTPYGHFGGGAAMPAVWTRTWGEGRVFYSAFGHDPAEFDRFPFVWDMTVRGLVWASRKTNS